MKLTGQTPAHLVGIGITPYTTGPNVVAINEPPAPTGSLRCDGVVGLLRADLIAVMGEVYNESIKADWKLDEHSHHRQRILAAEARGRHRALSEVYTKLVGILVAENVRQQQPNAKAEPQAQQNT